MKATLVIVGWMLGNWVLASLMWIWHENPIFIGLYFAGVAPLLPLGWAVRRSAARRGEPPRQLVVSRSSAPLLPLAIGLLTVGLGLVYGDWLSLVGLAILLGSFMTLTKPAGHPVQVPHRTEPYDLPLADIGGEPRLPVLIGEARERLDAQRHPLRDRLVAAVAFFGVRVLRRPAGRHRP